MSAVSDAPSTPSKRPAGSRNAVTRQMGASAPPLERSHSTSPAGNATAAARESTNRVLSMSERTRICPIFGRRNGGSSSTKDEGLPRRSVTERSLVTASVMSTARTRNPVSMSAETAPPPDPAHAAASEASTASEGRRPLQGMNELVSTPISLSRGESIILHPIAPAALQPKPMQQVSACLPQEPQARNGASISNAIRGRRPRSSRNVNSGKNIAIGGSITATTVNRVPSPPSQSAEIRSRGRGVFSRRRVTVCSSLESPSDMSREGYSAPRMVI